MPAKFVAVQANASIKNILRLPSVFRVFIQIQSDQIYTSREMQYYHLKTITVINKFCVVKINQNPAIINRVLNKLLNHMFKVFVKNQF